MIFLIRCCFYLFFVFFFSFCSCCYCYCSCCFPFHFTLPVSTNQLWGNCIRVRMCVCVCVCVFIKWYYSTRMPSKQKEILAAAAALLEECIRAALIFDVKNTNWLHTFLRYLLVVYCFLYMHLMRLLHVAINRTTC